LRGAAIMKSEIDGQWALVKLTSSWSDELRTYDATSLDGEPVITLHKGRFVQSWNDHDTVFFRVDPTQDPKQIILYSNESRSIASIVGYGIYLLDANELTIRLDLDRPTDFTLGVGLTGSLARYAKIEHLEN
jgi:hypothetical protein